MLDLDGEKAFLVKSPEWTYEREWRIPVSTDGMRFRLQDVAFLVLPSVDHLRDWAREVAAANRELAKALGNRPHGTIDDRLGGSALTIRFDREHRSAQAFDSSGRELPAFVAFWFAWTAFYPTAEIFVAH